MTEQHRAHVQALLGDAAAAHAQMLSRLPPEIAASLPVDGQGVTQAIDHLAQAAGLSERERTEMLLPHAVNPAVLHARVFGAAPLSADTVLASFVDGARVRAEALSLLADAVGGAELGSDVRTLLVSTPPPIDARADGAVQALRETYAAQEQAVLLIATALDARPD